MLGARLLWRKGMNDSIARRMLISILQAAYSGELGAGYAYRGHWKSVSNHEQRIRIQQIEAEEWLHREKVGQMLRYLGEAPQQIRELKMWIIGRTIGLACHIAGWFCPMYFAGRLESRNVLEYEEAARHAASLGMDQFYDELLVMAAVEQEHEDFFAHIVSDHRLLGPMQRLFPWQLGTATRNAECRRMQQPPSEGSLEAGD
jgi:demethoxyubiquinone hydroxylase (CLK1/Coq7/Cat5 family)